MIFRLGFGLSSWALGIRTFGLLALVVPALPAPLRAQSVRPIIAEYKRKAQGRFEVVNSTLSPFNVILEPKSFSISVDGEGVFRPLDRSIHLKLSAMSFHLPPQQSRYVFYEARADALPAWFVIYANFTALPPRRGISIQVELPHTVYMVQPTPLENTDVHVEEAEFLPSKHRVELEVDNNSERLGRALEVGAGSKRSKKVSSGFPLLPHSRRRVEIEWDSSDPPEVFWVRFARFTLREPLEAKTP